MKTALKRVAVCLCAFATASTCAPVEDFTVPGPYDFGQVLGNGQWSQSFTAESQNVAGAGVWVFSTPEFAGQTGNVELRLYGDLPASGGSALATGSSNVTLSGAPQFFDVFWTPVPTTVGNTYYLQILHSLPTGAAPAFAGDTYDAGNAYNNSAAFLNFDAPIRVFTEEASVVIPEPGAFALLLTGGSTLGLLALRTRLAKKRQGIH